MLLPWRRFGKLVLLRGSVWIMLFVLGRHAEKVCELPRYRMPVRKKLQRHALQGRLRQLSIV